MSHNYKFYLSFENGNCRGYVSEKLPKAFIWNLVPVIAGPVDWHAHVPNRNAAIYTEVGVNRLIRHLTTANNPPFFRCRTSPMREHWGRI